MRTSSLRPAHRIVTRFLGFLIAPVLIGGITSCLPLTGPDRAKSVGSVVVSPASATMTVGATLALTETTLDGSGNVVKGHPTTWSSDNTAVATVNRSGQVSAVAPGYAVISANCLGMVGTSIITVAADTVTSVPVASVSVSPASASIAVGGTQQLVATAKDAAGNTLGGRTVTWASDNTTSATVSGTGMVTGVAAGTAHVTATCEGKSGSSTITVTIVPVASVSVSPASATVAVGATTPLTATPKDASGNTLTGRTVTWASDNTTAATVSGSGVVTGVAAGTAHVTATCEGQIGSSTITVTLVPVASVSVTPASAGINVGATQQLTATPKDASGNTLTGRTITWASDNTVDATVSSSGMVRGVAAGTAHVTATCEGQSGSSTITVTLIPVASVSVTPASAGINVGATQQLTATPKDASGNTLTGRTITWASDNTTAATVSSSGLVRGVAAGTAHVTATCEGQSGSSTITVTLIPVASVSVTPASAGINVGATQQLTATPKDAAGNTLTGRTITWASDNTAAATVSSSGLVRGVAAGTAHVTATCESQSGSSTITVTLVPVASVSVTPATVSISVGATQQLTATPRDAGGNALTGRTITWVTDNVMAATVSSSGLVTGIGAGSANVTATCEGKTGTSAVTVTSTTTTSVLVGAGDIAVGGGMQSQTASLILNIPGTVFAAGDNCYEDGSLAQYLQYYDPTWGQFKSRTRPCPGNHEYHTSGAPDYYSYFGALAGPAGQGYYSYDVGSWHIISLNSETSMGTGSPQDVWLKADLAAHSTQCTIAYWHRPRFSSGDIHGDQTDVQPLWKDLSDAGASIVICGHEHDYQRYEPLDVNGNASPTGIREFVVGTGGANLYSITTPSPHLQAWNTDTYGVLKLTLGAGTYSWQFIPIAGQTYTDSGSGTCSK